MCRASLHAIVLEFLIAFDQQRVFIVDEYYSNKSPAKVKRAFANEYNLKINIRTVSKVVRKLRENGTIHSLNKGHSGCTRHVRSEENIVILNERIQENQSPSVRKLASEIGISRESARRIKFNLTKCKHHSSFRK